MAKKLPPSKRYPLLVLQRRFEMMRLITFLLPIFSLIAWWLLPDEVLWGFGSPALLGVAALTLVMFLVAVFAPFFCFVQCYADYILLSGPFYRYQISFAHLTEVLPVNFYTLFPAKQQGELGQMLLSSIYKQFSGTELTVVGIGVKKFKQPVWWLKFWFGKYLFHPRKPGMLLLTKNWMPLSHEVERYWHEWRERRRHKTQKVSLASRVLHNG